MNPSLGVAYSVAQHETIYQQLRAGSRYFDLRFMTAPQALPCDSAPRIYHLYGGPTRKEVFDDILKFLREPGHDKEIIILDFSNMNQGVANSTIKHSPNTAAQDRCFIDDIYAAFDNYIIPKQKKVTVNGGETFTPKLDFTSTQVVPDAPPASVLIQVLPLHQVTEMLLQGDAAARQRRRRW